MAEDILAIQGRLTSKEKERFAMLYHKGLGNSKTIIKLINKEIGRILEK